MAAQASAGRTGHGAAVTALRRCARLAGRARDGQVGAIEELVEALDPLHPLIGGGRPGPGASPVSSAWDGVGDLLAATSSAGLTASDRRALAASLAVLLSDLADQLAAAPT